MCGISALFAPNGDARLRDVVAMNALIAHRGPDSEGYVVLDTGSARPYSGAFTDPACSAGDTPFAPVAAAEAAGATSGLAVLGHRRLSILDLSASGHQPMSYAAGRLWITFNGEIYNFVELRSELSALGHRFVGSSDTEVLLASYSQWGIGSLERLRGMFAFVLVDRGQGTVLAARDRFGIKPLYYMQTPGGGLALGSEIKQLLPSAAHPPRVNGPRLYDFLNFTIHDHTDETMFEDVRQVPPGGHLNFRLEEPANPQPSLWWQLRPESFEGSFVEAARLMRERLGQSVAEHLRADVPVGSCLSGGLDSSTIVCLIQQQLTASGSGVPQRTFTATSSDKSVDETDWANLVSSAVGSEAFIVEPDMRMLAELLPKLTWHMDEPFGSSSIYAQWSVFELAAESRTTVLLDGQGADEQLAGYMPYFAWRLVELAASGRLRELRADVQGLRSLHPEALRRTVMLAGYLTTPPGLSRRLGRIVRAPGQVPDLWLSRERLGVEGFPDPLRQAGARARTVQGLGMSQLTASNLPMLLHYEDRDSMAHSIEARVPFLDHRVVELSTGLPSKYLISDGETKRVLREAMRGILPEATRTRVDKIGFQTAEERWVRGNPVLVRALVRRSVECLSGAITPGALDRVDRVLSGREPFDYWIWRAISAGAWAERFDVTV
jgi:asparagine synthase (glutamine-hydrolysing)